MISINVVNNSKNTSSEVKAISNIVNKKVEAIFQEEAVDSIKGNETIPLRTDTGDLKTIVLEKISSGNGGSLNIHYSDKEIEYILDQTINIFRIPIIDEEYNIYIEVPEWLNSYLTTTKDINTFADADPFSYLPMQWAQMIDQPLTKKTKLTLYINNSFYRSYIPTVLMAAEDQELLMYIPEDSFATLLPTLMSQNSESMNPDSMYSLAGKLLILGMYQGGSSQTVITLLPYQCSLGTWNDFTESVTIGHANDIRLLNWVEKLYLDYGEEIVSNYFQIETICKLSKGSYSWRVPMSCDFKGWPWKLPINTTDSEKGMIYGRSYVQYNKQDSTYTRTFLVDEDVFITGDDLKALMNHLKEIEQNGTETTS